MPAAMPLPSTVWPLRSIVMPSAPTTRPSHRQSLRSLRSSMLFITTMPQYAVVGTGAKLMVQSKVAGDSSVLPAASVARTQKCCSPAASGNVEPETHGDQVAPSSNEHSNVAAGSSLENVKVASVSTVIGSGPESTVVSGSVVSTGVANTCQVWAAGD